MSRFKRPAWKEYTTFAFAGEGQDGKNRQCPDSEVSMNIQGRLALSPVDPLFSSWRVRYGSGQSARIDALSRISDVPQAEVRART